MSSDSEALSVPAVPPATVYIDAPSAHATPHRVVSIATNLPGPFAARRFAELGMHVTKVEPPSGDLMEHYCRAYYGELIAGQHVCTIDLKSEDGAAELRDLLAQADLLLTSHRPAALLDRTHTGSGSYREVALADMAEHFGGPARHGLTSNDALLGGGIPQYGLYPAREGWVAVALLEPHFLADGLELLGISGDREEFQRILATKTAAEWEVFARRHNLPLAAVREGPHAPDPGEG